MASLVDTWKGIKADNQPLNNHQKYKPDVTPFLAKFDADAKKFDKLEQDKKGLAKILDDADQQIEGLAAKLKAQLEALQKAGDDVTAAESEPTNIDFDAPDAGAKVVALGTKMSNLAGKRAAPCHEIAKLSEQIAKVWKSSASQFKSKSDAIAAQEKVLSAEGTKLDHEIRRLVGVYQKIATADKDSKTATAVGKLISALDGGT
jgi:chromosome segregation ATPase